MVELLTNTSAINKNPKSKPGFKELGSVTPYDLAKDGNHTKVAKILQPFQQERDKDGRCNKPLFIECPPVKDSTIQCYEPNLLQGESK